MRAAKPRLPALCHGIAISAVKPPGCVPTRLLSPAMRLTTTLCCSLLTTLLWIPPGQAMPQRHGDGFSVGVEQITPHLQQQFPWQYELMPGVVSVEFRQPQLQLRDAQAQLAVDISITTLGQRTDLGRAQVASGLRFDPLQAAVYLQQPRLLGFTQADGRALPIDAQTAGMINEVLASYANQQPVYQLPPAYAALASTVQSLQIEDGRLRVRIAR